MRSATLTVRPDAEPLTEACAVLADRFPGLAAAAQAGEGPAAGLAAMLSALGLRVRLRIDADAETAAVLTADGEGAAGWTLPLAGARPKQAPDLLLEAVRRAYLSGADLRLQALAPAGAGFLGDLPTYPFQRERYWVDEPGLRLGEQPAGAAGSIPAPDGRDREQLTAYLIAELDAALEAGGGLDLDASPLEAGCDSFIFTLFITNVEANFPIGLTPEDLPLDLPAGVLIKRLADDIHRSALAGAPAAGGSS